MAKPAIIKVNQPLCYLDCYLHEHKPSKDASRIEKQKYGLAVRSVEVLKEMFSVPFPPRPGCKTPWYGGPVPRIRPCKTPWYGGIYQLYCPTPWMGKGPIKSADSKVRLRRAK